MKTKFAICNCNFENSRFELIIKDGQTVAVSPEFEKSPEFQEGLRVGNFEFVEIDIISELKKVINVTDEMIEDFMGTPKEEVPEVITIVEETVMLAPDVPEVPEELPNYDYETATITVDGVDEVSTDTVEEDLLPKIIDESVEDVVAEIEKEDETPILPDVDGMKYKPLQKYASELEKKFHVEIDRGARKAELLTEVKAVVEKYMK